jgi:hypothetical protein
MTTHQSSDEAKADRYRGESSGFGDRNGLSDCQIVSNHTFTPSRWQ